MCIITVSAAWTGVCVPRVECPSVIEWLCDCEIISTCAYVYLWLCSHGTQAGTEHELLTTEYENTPFAANSMRRARSL